MRTSFKMENEYITMTRGDTLSFGLKLLDENEQPFSQDLDAVYFSCKSNKSDDNYAFIKILGRGITKIGTGEYAVRIAPEDTKDLEARKYFYDLEIQVNGDVFTVQKGILDIEHDVTRNPSQSTDVGEYRAITHAEIDEMFRR